MQALRSASRSVIIDPIYSSFQSKFYVLHRKKLEQIKDRRPSQPSLTQEKQLHKIHRYKEAAHKVSEQFSNSRLQTQSLVNHIQKIMTRKSEGTASLNKFKSTAAAQQHRLIREENHILANKIKEERKRIVSKSDLRKQFAEYEELKKNIRRVTYESLKKQKHKKQ